MKKLMFVFPAVLLLMNLPAAYCQAPLKIGHINFEELMQALPEKDSVRAVFDKETKELQASYQELMTVYNRLNDEYQKGLETYSPAVRKMKEDELDDKKKRMAEFEKNANETLEKRNNELLQPLISKVSRAIEKVGEEGSFTYILDISKGTVVYLSKDSQNLDPLVLKILRPAR